VKTAESLSAGVSVAARRRLTRASGSLLILALLGLGVLLYLARAAFVPIALALLFAVLLSSAVEALHRLRVPRAISAVLLLTVLLIGVGAAAETLFQPAQQWLAKAPSVIRAVEKTLRPATGFMKRVESVTNRAGQLVNAPASANVSGPPVPATTAPPAATSISESQMMKETAATLASVGTCLALILFLLAGGPPMLARMAAAFAADLQVSHALRIIDAIRLELGRYYGTIALINVGLGAATAALMFWLGLPNPILWGVVAAVLNFIPYLGSATTLVVLMAAAAVAFDQPGRILAVVGGYLALATVEGQVIQPFLVGRRMDVNPVLVFLAVWFGGWFWGIAGIVIAVPGLVALKVAASHSANGGAVVEFLSPGGMKGLQSIRRRRRTPG
jgi:predicted PurR-regulated permease PerM